MRINLGKFTEPILLIGEGHGFDSLIRGVARSHISAQVFDPSTRSHALAKSLGMNPASSLEEWTRGSPGGLVVSSGFRERVSLDTLSSATFLNVHYANFPKYRGMHSIVWAMLNGDKKIGVTIHVMDEFIDAGPILWQHRIKVGEKSSQNLMAECNAVIERCVGRVLIQVMSGRRKARPQMESEATFVAKRNLEDCRIDWNGWDVVLFRRYLKALVPPYPRPFFDYKDCRYDLIEAELIESDYYELPGHVVYIREPEVYIKVKGGLLKVRTVFSHQEQICLDASAVFMKPGARLNSFSTRERSA